MSQNKGTHSSLKTIGPLSWAGKAFREYSLGKLSSLTPGTKILVGRGTSSIDADELEKRIVRKQFIEKVGDIPETKITLSTGRGTGIRKL